MKTTIKLSLCCTIAAFLLAGAPVNQSIAGTESRSAYQEAAPVSIDFFYQSLSPYGRWVSYPQYGQVWIPDVGSGFSPYSTNGHWVYTDYGWTWASDYSWGWAPFHYGRWLLDDYYGWIWVPGTEWAPAWVAWRNSPDYYGWAPLGPGVNISINIGIPTVRWVFIPRRYFGNAYGYRYYVPRQRNVYIIHNTTIINNTHVYRNNRYFSGPRRVEVEHSTNRSIRPVRVFNADRPGVTRVSNRQISIYRPTVEHGNNAPRASIANEHATRSGLAEGDNGQGARSGQENLNQRPQRNDNHAGENPVAQPNTESRSTRVFRGQENSRANTQPGISQPARPQADRPSRPATPVQHQQSQRPARESERVFNHQQSRQAPPAERSRPARSASVQRAPAVHAERSAPRAVSRESRGSRESRPGRR